METSAYGVNMPKKYEEEKPTTFGARPLATKPEQTIGFGLDRLPPKVDAGQAPTNAESVALNQPQHSTPSADGGGFGVRKITGADGSTTYTNDPQQPGGVALGVNNSQGTLSTIGDPRTEGMTPAQASAYWQSQSAALDEKNKREQLEAIALAGDAGPSEYEKETALRNARMTAHSINAGVGRQKYRGDEAAMTTKLAEMELGGASNGETRKAALDMLKSDSETQLAQAKAIIEGEREIAKQDRADARQQRNIEAQDSRLNAQLDSRERIQAANAEAAAGKVRRGPFKLNCLTPTQFKA